MRFQIRAMAIAVCSLLYATGATDADERPSKFGLDVRTLVAIEGGPVVVVSNLKYSGTGPLSVVFERTAGKVVDAPEDWEMVRPIAIAGTKKKFQSHRFEGSGSIRRFSVFDGSNPKVRSGKYQVVIDWKIAEERLGDDLPPPVIADLNAAHSIQVSRRDAKSVSTIVRVLESLLGPEPDAELAVAAQAATDFPELVPLAIRLSRSGFGEPMSHWYFSRLPERNIRQQLFAILDDSKNPDPMAWAWSWREHLRKCPVSEEDSRRMRESDNQVTRFACFIAFPESFRDDPGKSLLAQAAKLRPPINDREFKLLIERLGMAAEPEVPALSAKIVSVGARALDALHAAKRDAPVPSRIEKVISAIKESPTDDATARVISFCKSYYRHLPNAKQLLEALAANASDSPVAKASAEALAAIRADELQRK